MQNIDRPSYVQSLPEPAGAPRPRGDVQAPRVVTRSESRDRIPGHYDRGRHVGQRVAVRSPEVEGAVG